MRYWYTCIAVGNMLASIAIYAADRPKPITASCPSCYADFMEMIICAANAFSIAQGMIGDLREENFRLRRDLDCSEACRVTAERRTCCRPLDCANEECELWG